MKLFLASHDFGDFAEELRQLVGENRKTLLITNARDIKEPDVRRQAVRDKLATFKREGFDAVELDLREYFAKDPDELKRFVDDYNPGLIFSIGGDVFLLATALAVSGMDDIIHQRLEQDITVYGGSSAGSMVAATDIENYERDELRIEEVEAYYGIESVTNGLGLIDKYIIPHADVPKYQNITKFYKQQFAKLNVETIVLGDRDAYIVNGNHKVVKRGRHA